MSTEYAGGSSNAEMKDPEQLPTYVSVGDTNTYHCPDGYSQLVGTYPNEHPGMKIPEQPPTYVPIGETNIYQGPGGYSKLVGTYPNEQPGMKTPEQPPAYAPLGDSNSHHDPGRCSQPIGAYPSEQLQYGPPYDADYTSENTANKKASLGDIQEARKMAGKAKSFMIAAVVCGVMFIIVDIILLVLRGGYSYSY